MTRVYKTVSWTRHLKKDELKNTINSLIREVKDFQFESYGLDCRMRPQFTYSYEE